MKRSVLVVALAAALVALIAAPAQAVGNKTDLHYTGNNSGSIYAVSGSSFTARYELTNIGCNDLRVESTYIVQNVTDFYQGIGNFNGIEFGYHQSRIACQNNLDFFVTKHIKGQPNPTDVAVLNPCCGENKLYRFTVQLDANEKWTFFYVDLLDPGTAWWICSNGVSSTNCTTKLTVDPYGSWNGRGPSYVAEEQQNGNGEFGTGFRNIWTRDPGNYSGWRASNPDNNTSVFFATGNFCGEEGVIQHGSGSYGDNVVYSGYPCS